LIVLAVFSVLIWRVFLYEKQSPVVLENIKITAPTIITNNTEENIDAADPIKLPDIAINTIIDKIVLMTDEPEAPKNPINTALYESAPIPEETESETTALNTVENGTGAPVRIRIPSIALDAAIERVALTADGSMDVPKNPKNTGWYELGAIPGETGSAVIAGHVNWWNGVTGAFELLNTLKPGDKIEVQNDKGAVISFIVREIRSYDAQADAIDVFSSDDEQSHLNLITCEGIWDKNTSQYSKRLVVFTDKN